MADVYPNEVYPADTVIAALDGTTDTGTGLAYVAKGTGPASTPSYEIQYNRRQQRENRRLAIATAGLVVDEGSLNIGVYPFDYCLAGQFKHFAGATSQAVPDDATRYVYVDVANTLQIAASEPADVTSFVPLAQVVTAGGGMTITPRTNYSRLSVSQLGSGAAGDGLSLSGGVLSVNADGSTLETSADAIQIKDTGVTAAKLADAVAGLLTQLNLSVGPEGTPAADDRVVTVQLQDARGNNLAARALVRVWVATSDFGSPSATGNTVTVTTGTTYATETANAAYKLMTDATGKAEIQINVSGAATRYVMAELDGKVYSTGGVNWAA